MLQLHLPSSRLGWARHPSARLEGRVECLTAKALGRLLVGNGCFGVLGRYGAQKEGALIRRGG